MRSVRFNAFGTGLSLAAWAIEAGALTNDLLSNRCAALETITAGAIVDQQFLGKISWSAF